MNVMFIFIVKKILFKILVALASKKNVSFERCRFPFPPDFIVLVINEFCIVQLMRQEIDVGLGHQR